MGVLFNIILLLLYLVLSLVSDKVINNYFYKPLERSDFYGEYDYNKYLIKRKEALKNKKDFLFKDPFIIFSPFKLVLHLLNLLADIIFNKIKEKL